MKVRNRFLVEVGRVLAMATAVAMGSALAMAQVPATESQKDKDAPKESQLDRSKAAIDRQKDAAEDVPADPNQPTKSRADQPARTEQPARAGQPKARTEPSDQPTKKGQTQPQPRRSADPATNQRADDPTRGTDVRRGGTNQGQVAGQGGAQRRVSGLGIQFDENAQGAIVVGNIEAESNAARAGLLAGDRIVSIDGRDLRSVRQFQAYLSAQQGRVVPVIIERGGQRYTIQLSPAEMSGEGPWLGVYLNDNEENQTGARITNVFPGGPAARAGLRAGDVIQQINGNEVAGTADLIAMIDEFQPQNRVEFLVLRGEQQITVPTVLGSREAFVFHRGQNADDGDYNDEFEGISPQLMSLEHDRRMAEQHERIESELRKLQEEIRQLREIIEKK